MKLIDILIEELPKHGGWPEGVEFFTQDYDGELCPDGMSAGYKYRSSMLSTAHRGFGTYDSDLIDRVTRAEYDLALAAKQQPVNNDAPKQKPALQLVEPLSDVNKTLQRKSTFTLATEFNQAGLHVIDASRKLFWCAGLLVATPDRDSSSMQTVESDRAEIIESLESALRILKGNS